MASPAPNAAVTERRCSDHRRGSAMREPNARRYQRSRSVCGCGVIFFRNRRGMRARNSTRSISASFENVVVNLCALGLLGGVMSLLLLAQLPSGAGVVFACSAGALACALSRRWRPAIAVASAAAGFVLASAHAHDYLQQRWPAVADDERAFVGLVVDEVPVVRGDAWQFEGVARLQSPVAHERWLRIRAISRDARVRPHAGERWRLLLALHPPRAHVNPG